MASDICRTGHLSNATLWVNVGNHTVPKAGPVRGARGFASHRLRAIWVAMDEILLVYAVIL